MNPKHPRYLTARRARRAELAAILDDLVRRYGVRLAVAYLLAATKEQN